MGWLRDLALLEALPRLGAVLLHWALLKLWHGTSMQGLSS